VGRGVPRRPASRVPCRAWFRGQGFRAGSRLRAGLGSAPGWVPRRAGFRAGLGSAPGRGFCAGSRLRALLAGRPAAETSIVTSGSAAQRDGQRPARRIRRVPAAAWCRMAVTDHKWAAQRPGPPSCRGRGRPAAGASQRPAPRPAAGAATSAATAAGAATGPGAATGRGAGPTCPDREPASLPALLHVLPRRIDVVRGEPQAAALAVRAVALHELPARETGPLR